jgi:TonB family protein
LVFAPLLMAAAEPVRLQPSSPWVVDYAKDSCRLARMFGNGKTTTKLAFESDAPDEMDMVAIGWPLDTYNEQISARFLPVSGKPFDGKVARTDDTHEPAILWRRPRLLPEKWADQQEEEQKIRGQNPEVRPPAQSLAEMNEYKSQRAMFAAATTEIAVQTRRGREVILETGSLGAAVARLDQCSEDSLKDWGVDPAIEAKIVRPVWAANSTRWLSANDYPRDLINSGKESEVVVRLLIDASGKVTKCTSLTHFDEPAFNQITCSNITKRARFEPAELADGTKVPSYYTRRVVFRIAR